MTYFLLINYDLLVEEHIPIFAGNNSNEILGVVVRWNLEADKQKGPAIRHLRNENKVCGSLGFWQS